MAGRLSAAFRVLTVASAADPIAPDDGVVMVGIGVGVRLGISVVKFDATGIEESATEVTGPEPGSDDRIR